jgi:general nucleoside transport system permease protein
MGWNEQAAAVREALRRLPSVLRWVLTAAAALAVFAAVLLAAGKDPLKAYADTFAYTFGNLYGLTELLVRMTPILFTAVAVALPSRMGLINVGAEGQLLLGALFASGAALAFPGLPAAALLPLMAAAGFLGGGIWAAVPGVLRARGLVNETISTLLLNYVAPLILSWFLFGPWRSPESSSYPQSAAFVPAARLPSFLGTRVHLGLPIALAGLLLYGFAMGRTRWGLEMRAIGGNQEAAERAGIPWKTYIVIGMFVAGGMAGLAGMAEASAIHGRLRTGLSPGYGFTGFLVSWLAGGRPAGIVAMSLLFALITSVGDILQITQGLPYAAVNILLAALLFLVLGWGRRSR